MVAATGGGHCKAPERSVKSKRQMEASIVAQSFSQLPTMPHIRHEQDDAQEGDAERDDIQHTGKGVVETMERSRDDQCQEPQCMAITGVEACHTDEVAGDAAPDSMDERQRRQSRDVQDKRRGIVGADIDRCLILHTLKHAEGDTRHEAIEDHRLRKHRLAAAALEDEERDHLRELLRQSHAQDITDDAHRESGLGKDIEDVEPVKRAEDEEHAGLGEEECPDRCGGMDLTRAEHISEEQSPDRRKIERDSIEDEQAANRQEHDDGQRETDDSQDEQSLVLEERVPLNILLGQDKVAADMCQLPEE